MTRLIKTTEEIAALREGGQLLATMLQKLAGAVKAGVSTETIETAALTYIEEAGGRPAFKGYKPDQHSRPFPTALCISINEEIVHAPALPARTFKEGDVVTVDIGMEWPWQPGTSGYYTDMATTVVVGKAKADVARLLTGTEEALYTGIATVKAGVTLLELGTAIEAVLKKHKLGIIRDLVGHGVGLDVHEEPQVPNYGFRKGEFPNIELQAGMVIAIEPMATLGSYHIAAAPDGFTYVTADHSLVAHFEHTVLVTAEGSEILTALPN